VNARKPTIRRRLVTAMTWNSTIVLVLVGVLLLVYDAVSYRRQTIGMVSIRAEIMASNLTSSLAFRDANDARELLSSLRADPHLEVAAVYDQQGRLFASFPPATNAPTTLVPVYESSARFARGGIEVLRPVSEGDRWLGSLYLRSDLRALNSRLRLYALVVLGAVIGAMGVAFALSRWFQRGVSGPVSELALAARTVAGEKDFSVRVAVPDSLELEQLTQSFNEMLATIQQRDAEILRLNGDLELRVQARTYELEALNRELEAFSYSVSHDLRAPLRHINGFADLLRRHGGDHLDDKALYFVDHISDSARKMGQLIDDLLAFSRLSRLEMKAVAVPLAVLVQDVRRTLESDLVERRVDWRIAELPDVQGDPAMLRQVLVNLMSNALKYSSKRETAEIRIDCVQSSEETIVTVRDNGVGFDMAYAPKLFGVFQRLHSAEEFEGTGIGLALVRRIVNRHGGRTWAEGEPGVGAAFSFSIPRALGQDAGAAKEAA
jgi:signal transduction histidine kinase